MQASESQESQNQAQGGQIACLIGLGANLGDRAQTLNSAIAVMAGNSHLNRVAASAFYESAPIGGPPGQPPFLNAAATLRTSLPAGALLQRLHAIEADLGRTRGQQWSARTIDLDLLLYGEQVIETESLVVPHPRLPFRRFVLEPAVEVAADWVHPPTGRPLRELLERIDRRPIRIALGSDFAEAAGRIKAAVADHIRAGDVELIDLARADDSTTLAVLAEGQMRSSNMPALAIPSGDVALAITEITAAIEAIKDSPRRLPASAAAKPPADRQQPPGGPC